MASQRYARAKPSIRANSALRSARTHLGHVFHDVARKTKGDERRARPFAKALSLAFVSPATVRALPWRAAAV
jgi:peptide methionine sulfoxide reductase MsrB